MECGGRCAVMAGTVLMPRLHADSCEQMPQVWVKLLNCFYQVFYFCHTALVTNIYYDGAESHQLIHIDEVNCTGHEDALAECQVADNHNCADHTEDVGIICSIPHQGRAVWRAEFACIICCLCRVQ